ncbi:T9SS type A sorting domain-containing protein [Pontibacter aquaedesilientis]|nr:T9SS type A sorting domain-containing protein [Pontibacter aquaedesilientis]
MLGTEPVGDVKNGASDGHTDFVSPSPLQAYYNGQHLMFRMRVGGASTSQRGYSVLIDANNTFAGTGPNPGFEYELVLASGFNFRLIQHTGTTRQTILEGAATQFSQRAVAASTAGGTPDYFIDFYVPQSAFGGQITTTTPLRMVGSTVNRGQSALIELTQVADVAGVNFLSYNQDALAAWRDIITTFPPTTLNDLVADEVGEIRTFPPIISSPITAGATTIGGTSREAAGTIIQVLRNGTTLGTTSVTSAGTWIFTVPSGTTLAAGNQITATATATGRPVSATSNTVIVTAAVCTTPPPAITGLNSPRREINGTAAPGAVVRVYRNGVLVTTSTGAQSTVANAQGLWVLIVCPPGGGSGNNNCVGNGIFTATQQIGTGCESNPSTPFNNGLADNTSTPPTIGTSPLCVTTSSISGTTAPSAFVTLFLNNRPVNLVTTSNNAYTVQSDAAGAWTITGNLGFKQGDVIFVRSRTASAYYGQSSSATVVTCQSTPPVITGEYCGVTTSVSGTSTEPEGTSIQIYADGIAVGTPAMVNQAGFWTVSGLEIPQGIAFTARATAPNSSQSVDSAPVTATPQTSAEGLAVNGPITEGSTTITGTGTAGAQLTVYIDGTPYTPITIPPSGSWSLTGFSTTELFPGAEVTATQTITGQCASEPAESVFVDCNPLTTSFSVTSSSASTICGGSTPVTINVASSQTGVAYTIILPDGSTSGSSVLGTGEAITLISGPIANNSGTNQNIELRIRARRITGSQGPNLPESCEAILNESITRTILPQPPINYTLTPSSSNVCAGSTVNVQLMPSATGYTYQLVNEATGALVGTAVSGTGGAITLSTGAINSGNSYGVVIINSANSCTFTDPGRYTATISGPAIDRPFFTPTTSVCVGGAANLFLSTQANSTYRYSVYRVAPGGVTTQIANNLVGNGEVRVVSTGVLNTPGTYSFYAEVTGGSCLQPIRILEDATIVVTNDAGVANAGEDRTVCGSDVIISAAVSPDPGTGIWEFVGDPRGATIINPNSQTTTVRGLQTGTYTLRWTVTTACSGSPSATSVDEMTITVNCPSTYVIMPPKYRDEYIPNDMLAVASDSDGGIASAILLAGSLPPGVSLNATNGDIFVVNPDALVTGLYTFTVRLADVTGATTDITLTLEILENSPVIIPLPVELVYFTATVRNNQATLQWLTASEQDNDRFEIERSADAKSFEKIGTVKGKGTSSVENKYEYADRTPVQGTVYYRLKQVDLDGEFAYSKVIAVNAKGLASELSTQVYPNPFPGMVKLTLTAPQKQAAEMVIYDMNGRQVLRKTLELEAGVNSMELQLQQLQSGMYFLKIVSDGMESTTKLIRN